MGGGGGGGGGGGENSFLSVGRGGAALAFIQLVKVFSCRHTEKHCVSRVKGDAHTIAIRTFYPTLEHATHQITDNGVMALEMLAP